MLKFSLKNILLEKSRYKKEKVDLPSRLSVLEKYKNDPYILVHFSELNKLGINPKTSYDTPAGIYGYNLKVLYNDILNNKLEFANDRKFMHVFRIKPEFQNRVVIVSEDCDTENGEYWKDKLEKLKNNDSSQQFNYLKDEIVVLYNEILITIHEIFSIINEKLTDVNHELEHKYNNINYQLNDLENLFFNTGLLNFQQNKKFIFELINSANAAINNFISYVSSQKEIKNYIGIVNLQYSKLEYLIENKLKKFELEEIYLSDMDLKKTLFKTPFGYFYNATRLIGKDTLGWNKVLRQHGVSAIIDNGCGMIHKNEPAQGVVLSGQFIEHLETIENPYENKSNEHELKIRKFLIKKTIDQSWVEKNYNFVIDNCIKLYNNGFPVYKILDNFSYKIFIKLFKHSENNKDIFYILRDYNIHYETYNNEIFYRLYNLFKNTKFDILNSLIERLSKDENAPEEILKDLVINNSKDIKIKIRLSQNPNSTSEIIRLLYEQFYDNKSKSDIENNIIIDNICKHKNTPGDILLKLSNAKDSTSRSLVAKNINTPVDALLKLSNDSSDIVRYSVANNPNSTKEILLKLIEDLNDNVSTSAKFSYSKFINKENRSYSLKSLNELFPYDSNTNGGFGKINPTNNSTKSANGFPYDIEKDDEEDEDMDYKLRSKISLNRQEYDKDFSSYDKKHYMSNATKINELKKYIKIIIEDELKMLSPISSMAPDYVVNQFGQKMLDGTTEGWSHKYNFDGTKWDEPIFNLDDFLNKIEEI